MPQRDITGVELAKLKRVVHGFQVCFLCCFYFFSFIPINDLQCCSKSWDILEIWLCPNSLWGFLWQIVFSDPSKYWGSCWVTGMGMEKGWPYLAVRNFTAALALWCTTLAGALRNNHGRSVLCTCTSALLASILAVTTTQNFKMQWWRPKHLGLLLM